MTGIRISQDRHLTRRFHSICINQFLRWTCSCFFHTFRDRCASPFPYISSRCCSFENRFFINRSTGIRTINEIESISILRNVGSWSNIEKPKSVCKTLIKCCFGNFSCFCPSIFAAVSKPKRTGRI